MEDSENGYELANRIVLRTVMRAVDGRSPGSVQRILDNEIVELSELLENDPREEVKEALFRLSNWRTFLLDTPPDYDVTPNVTELTAEVTALGMRLSCLIDALTTTYPNLTDVIDDNAIRQLQKMVEESPLPRHVLALKKLLVHRFIGGGTDYETAVRMTEEAMLQSTKPRE